MNSSIVWAFEVPSNGFGHKCAKDMIVRMVLLFNDTSYKLHVLRIRQFVDTFFKTALNMIRPYSLLERYIHTQILHQMSRFTCLCDGELATNEIQHRTSSFPSVFIPNSTPSPLLLTRPKHTWPLTFSNIIISCQSIINFGDSLGRWGRYYHLPAATGIYSPHNPPPFQASPTELMISG